MKKLIIILGILLYELSNGCLPFSNVSDEELINSIINQKNIIINNDIDLKIKYLIQNMLINENDRISIEKIKN